MKSWILILLCLGSLALTGAACFQQLQDEQGNSIPGSSQAEKVGQTIKQVGEVANTFVPGAGLVASLIGNVITFGVAMFSHTRGKGYKKALGATVEAVNEFREESPEASKALLGKNGILAKVHERRGVRKIARRVVHLVENGSVI